jgi:hypothetical protein
MMIAWLWNLPNSILNAIQRHVDRRRRDFDLKALWPSCKKQANNIDHAKAAFAIHVFNDSAWTDYFSQDELKAFIDALE